MAGAVFHIAGESAIAYGLRTSWTTPVLSRLISLLSRIPAVKWAFNRLRPLPHSGSIDVAQIAADEEPALIAAAVPVAEADTTVSVIEEEVSISSVGIASETVDAPELITSDPPAELLTNVEPDIVEEAPVSAVEVEAVEVLEPVIINDASPEVPADVEPAVEELGVIAPVATESVSVEPCELVAAGEPASGASVKLEPVAVDETPGIDSQPVPSVAAEIEPSPAPKSPSAPKARAKVVEPTDRAALIRQRWAETGIRMWNPRLHGMGEATLNIQGRIGLLPPEPGETLPRYDKLEFKLLGGEIVCEGVIVEAPVHAGQRSFTRLAEPRGADRARGLVRERQAALA